VTILSIDALGRFRSLGVKEYRAETNPAARVPAHGVEAEHGPLPARRI
jgi:hypothetical protein